ncbi:MAG: type II toxin-antitoxin system HicB family antitoxin, partial [Candidatus Aminicenantaceae bacterium]
QKHYVSCCPVLDVWSQGETIESATENLREALQLFLIDCYERSTLDKVLKDSGFTAARTPPKKQMSPSKKRIDIVLPFIIDDRHARCQG